MPYTTLKSEMAKRHITIEQIAKSLNIHRNSVANKLNKKSSFSIEEAERIQEKFFSDIPIKNLFSKDG